MDAIIKDFVPPVALRDLSDRFWSEEKGSDFLDRVFREFYGRLQLFNPMSKSTFHRLASLAKPEELDKEVIEVLDQIVGVAEKAKPAGA